MSRSPRIAFCGNIGNTLFQIARAVRAAGIDAHLFVGTDDPLSYRPESDVASLANAYPDWIHEGNWLERHHGVVPFRSPLVDELRSYDLIVASGTYPVVAHLAGVPMVFLTTGADLTITPFPWRSRHRHRRMFERLGYLPVGFWQRRAIRTSHEVWTQPFRPFQEPLQELGVNRGVIRSTALSLAIDTEAFAPVDDHPEQVRDDILELQDSSDFIALHPSRLVFAADDQMTRTGQAKGSSETIKGFAAFVSRGLVERPRLVMPRRGPELSAADELIESLEIGPFVHWAEPPRSGGFTRTEMVSYYSIANVVIDQFSAGWFGNVSLEGMSCGKPVVARIDHDAVEQMYGEDHHWLHADDADGLAQRLSAIAADPEGARILGSECRRWAQRHHSLETSEAKYVRLCTEAIGALP